MFTSHSFFRPHRLAKSGSGVASQPLHGNSERYWLFAVDSEVSVRFSVLFDHKLRALSRDPVEVGVPVRVVYSFGISRFSTRKWTPDIEASFGFLHSREDGVARRTSTWTSPCDVHCVHGPRHVVQAMFFAVELIVVLVKWIRFRIMAQREPQGEFHSVHTRWRTFDRRTDGAFDAITDDLKFVKALGSFCTQYLLAPFVEQRR